MTGRPRDLTAWIDLNRLARIGTPHAGWERYGNCYKQGDTNRFFPSRDDGGRQEARQICDGCPAVYACLAAAVTRPEFNDKGIWGGTSERQRRGIRRALNQRRRALEGAA